MNFCLKLNRFQKYCLFRRTKRKKKVDTRKRLELTSHTYEKGRGIQGRGVKWQYLLQNTVELVTSFLKQSAFEVDCRTKVVVAYLFFILYYLILSLLYMFDISIKMIALLHQILVPKHMYQKNKWVNTIHSFCFISNGPTIFIICVAYKPLLIKQNECSPKKPVISDY